MRLLTQKDKLCAGDELKKNQRAGGKISIVQAMRRSLGSKFTYEAIRAAWSNAPSEL